MENTPWFFKYQIIQDNDRTYTYIRRNKTKVIPACILYDLDTCAELCYGTYQMCLNMLWELSGHKYLGRTSY